MKEWLSRQLGRREGSEEPDDELDAEQRQELLSRLQQALALQPQLDMVRDASGRFGYDRANPIPVHEQRGQLEYLARLRCSCGEPFMFHRQGSVGPGPDGHPVDCYELICKTKQHHLILYLDMYHQGPSSLLPDELSADTPLGIGLPVRIDDFPEGVIPAILAAMKSGGKA